MRRMPIPLPLLPEWAKWSGLPEPGPQEGFCEYVRRLGLDPEPLLAGLNEGTYGLLNTRLAAALMRHAPDAHRRYLDARRAVPPN